MTSTTATSTTVGNQPPIADFITMFTDAVAGAGETLLINAPGTPEYDSGLVVFFEAENAGFGAVSSDPDGEIVSFRWVVDSVDVGTGLFVPYDAGPLSDGTHEVTLFVTDDDGATSDVTAYLERVRT